MITLHIKSFAPDPKQILLIWNTIRIIRIMKPSPRYINEKALCTWELRVIRSNEEMERKKCWTLYSQIFFILKAILEEFCYLEVAGTDNIGAVFPPKKFNFCLPSRYHIGLACWRSLVQFPAESILLSI